MMGCGGEELVGLETGHEVVGKGPKGKVERGKLCQGRLEGRVNLPTSGSKEVILIRESSSEYRCSRNKERKKKAGRLPKGKIFGDLES